MHINENLNSALTQIFWPLTSICAPNFIVNIHRHHLIIFQNAFECKTLATKYDFLFFFLCHFFSYNTNLNPKMIRYEMNTHTQLVTMNGDSTMNTVALGINIKS